MDKTCTGCVVSAGTHKPAEALHQIAEKQNEALRLADALAERVAVTATGTSFDGDLAYSVAELRAQHARIAELEAICDEQQAGIERLRAQLAATQDYADRMADMQAAPQAVQAAVPTDDELTMAWIAAGGEFFGPNTPTGSMPESKLFPFLRQLAATQPAAQGMDANGFLREADYDDLWRFEGMAADGEGYDISKERMKRLAELGVIRWCGGSRYGVTAFGLYVLKAWQRLPLETYEESNARCNAEFKARIERLNAEALAAQAKQGGV